MDKGLVIQNLNKVFEIQSHKVVALQDINLEIAPGDLVGITGKSGAGKSTLLHIIGLLDKPSSGSIKMNGIEVSTLNDKKASQYRNQVIGFVFQMNNLLHEFSALENVMMPGLIAGMPKDKLTNQALEMLAEVGLGHRSSHRPGELSGGEQQRVAIARALVLSPSFLLADEPTGNLDNKTSESIQQLLFRLCKDFSMTMLLVTHDLDLAKRLPVQIQMEDGRITQFTR